MHFIFSHQTLRFLILLIGLIQCTLFQLVFSFLKFGALFFDFVLQLTCARIVLDFPLNLILASSEAILQSVFLDDSIFFHSFPSVYLNALL